MKGERKNMALTVGSIETHIPDALLDPWTHSIDLKLDRQPDAAALWERGRTPHVEYAATGLMYSIEAAGYPDFSFAAQGQYDGARLIRPYSHFALVAGEDAEFSGLMRELSVFHRASFGELTDDDPRFGFFTSSVIDRPRLYFGPGIYVPDDGATPIARLSFHLDSGASAWTSPTLTCHGERTEAGFYTGQLGVLACSSALFGPAVLDSGRLDPHGSLPNFQVHFGAKDPLSPPGVRAKVRVADRWAEQPMRHTPPEELTSQDGIRIDLGQKASLRMRYEPDIRDTPILRAPPGGAALEISGLMLPARRASRTGAIRVETTLDFDGEWMPLTNPLQTCRRTLQVAHRSFGRRSLMAYDWQKRRWLDCEKRPDCPPRFQALEFQEYRLAGLCDGYLVRRADCRPFGYLQAPFETELTSDLNALLDCGGAMNSGGVTHTWSRWFDVGRSIALSPGDGSLILRAAYNEESLARALFLPSPEHPEREATPRPDRGARIPNNGTFFIGGLMLTVRTETGGRNAG